MLESTAMMHGLIHNFSIMMRLRMLRWSNNLG